jgi:hypothetical protein
LWAAGLGVVYLIGRQIYAATYIKDPAKRGPGYGLTFVPTVILIAGSALGALRQLIWP